MNTSGITALSADIVCLNIALGNRDWQDRADSRLALLLLPGSDPATRRRAGYERLRTRFLAWAVGTFSLYYTGRKSHYEPNKITRRSSRAYWQQHWAE
jgi:hypothetical protein